MGRVINPDNAGKQRTQHMRTAAEILRRLSQKTDLDSEARDLVSALVFLFRDIDEGIEVSAAAWEKRDYWMKSEELRRRWGWPGRMADELKAMVLGDKWEQLPTMLVKLLPYFADIKITKLTRDDSEWLGSHARLMQEKPPTR
jgi:hypothetical protein